MESANNSNKAKYHTTSRNVFVLSWVAEKWAHHESRIASRVVKDIIIIKTKLGFDRAKENIIRTAAA